MLVLAVGADDGGFFPQTWRWTSLALFAATGAALLLREQVVVSGRDWLALGTLFGSAAWMLVSRAWSAVPALAAPEAERALVYGAALLAFLVLFEAGSTAWVLAGVVGAAVVLSAWGIADYLSAPGGEPLVGPLGYANGAGALAAIAVVVCTGLALHRRSPIALAPALVLVPALALSESSGAWLALVAGLAVLAVVERRRIPRGAFVAAGAGAAAVVIVWLSLGHPAGAVTGNIRWSYWRVALRDEYGGHPLLGSGAGSFGRYWAEHKTSRLGALDAHSLFVESLAELGLVGIVLVLVFIGTVAWTAAKEASGLTAVAAAGFATYAVHTGIDWDWELPAVTLTGVVLAGLVLAGADRATGARPLAARTQLALASAATSFAVLALVRLKTAGGR